MATSKIRPLILSLNQSQRWKYKHPEYTIDTLVVGGGVVGLAIARALALQGKGKEVFLVERNKRFGEETSARNSEVIHSGLYYPPNSLKTRLCLRGRDLLYSYCSSRDIPHRQTGKLVVATDPSQVSYLEGLHSKSLALGEGVLDTKLITGEEARSLEPNLHPSIPAALQVPITGIVDSHSLMSTLEKEFLDTEGSEVLYDTSLVRLDPSPEEEGWVVQTSTSSSQEGDAFLAKTIVNAAGLFAPVITNTILPPSQEAKIPMYFAKGSYASYKGPGTQGIRHLIYPCPPSSTSANTTKEGAGSGGGGTQRKHAFQSLGTHLTLDMNGQIKFGPDLEWLSPPSSALSDSVSEDEANFWHDHLRPSSSNLTQMYEAVRTYLPNVTLESFAPDYVGIRPKLVGPDGGFQDFVFREDGEDKRRMISLLGIESPGLTASLALAEEVCGMVSKK